MAVAVPAVSCSDPGVGSGETPVTKTGTGPRDDACVHVGGETCQRKPGCNRQQGRVAPSHAATYKLARLACS